MKYLFAPTLVLISILCSAALAQPATGSSPAAAANPTGQQQSAPSKEQRGTRSNNEISSTSSVVQPNNWNCSLHAARFDIWRLEVAVTTLSTYRLQPCPASRMEKVNAASAAAQLRTVANFSTIVKGGSHQQIMDINLTPVSSEYVWVGDLKFSVLGSTRISLRQLFQTTKLSDTKNLAGANYVAFRFSGNTHYIWNTGSLVHRLVSPKGETYLMTDFTQEVEPSLTRDNLSNLDTMLRLPPGWKFENYFLGRTIVVRAGVDNNNSVEVLFDDMNNSYVLYQ
jgi:hypothetical protein